MKEIKKLNAKKVVLALASFVLLVVTLFTIMINSDSAYAKISPDGIELTQSFVTGKDKNGNDYLETVTDEGRFYETNHVMIFSCIGQFEDVKMLKHFGYAYVTVSLEFEMREVDDGYQHIYLFSRVSDRDEVAHVKLDYFGGKTMTEFHTVTVDFKSYPLDYFAINNIMNICLRFDASGGGSDTWQYKNLYFTVEVSKTNIRKDTCFDDHD